MKRDFMLGTVFSVALAAAVSAQSTAQTPIDQEKSAKPSDSSQTVTVTGCLKSSDSGSTSSAAGAPAANPTAGQPSTPASGGYILTDASTSSGSSATGTTGSTAGTPTAGAAGSSPSMSGTTYRLTGSASNFSSLVGKRVEVKGTLQNRASSSGSSSTSPGSTAGSTAGGSQSPRTGSMSDTSNAPQLRVTSLREVPGGTCSSEGR